MRKIELVDLKTQYIAIKDEINKGIQEVLDTTSFIHGPAVKNFQTNLSTYLDGVNVIPCANGTDALQIAMMALGLQPGDEVITPSFTYAATAEVIALLRLTPVFVDVNPQTFNIDPAEIEKAISSKTKAIVPVHLFGQCADMERILEIASTNNLFVIEDAAQSIGSEYIFGDGTKKKSGTMGTIAGTSFFPSKNLGCYGDGGAIFTNNVELANTVRMIANHGQTSLYYHDIVGVNSRLDSIQAAILDVKLKHLNRYNEKRQNTAAYYNNAFKTISDLKTPFISPNSTHVFHQYTLTCKSLDQREALKKHLDENQIPNKIYYPVPLHLQKAYNLKGYTKGSFPVSEQLADTVISLPMHTELDEEQLEFITTTIKNFFN